MAVSFSQFCCMQELYLKPSALRNFLFPPFIVQSLCSWSTEAYSVSRSFSSFMGSKAARDPGFYKGVCGCSDRCSRGGYIPHSQPPLSTSPSLGWAKHTPGAAAEALSNEEGKNFTSLPFPPGSEAHPFLSPLPALPSPACHCWCPHCARIKKPPFHSS